MTRPLLRFSGRRLVKPNEGEREQMSKRMKAAKAATIVQTIPATNAAAVFADKDGNNHSRVHLWATCDDGKVRGMVLDDSARTPRFAECYSDFIGYTDGS